MTKHRIFISLLLSTVFLTACGPKSVSPYGLGDGPYGLGDGGVSSFYQADDLPRAQAGTLLRQEPLTRQQSLSGAARNLRLLYASTSGLDAKSPEVVSGALFLPKGTPPKGGWPLLLWSHGTVGIADRCAPSWTGYVAFHQEHLNHWLAQGYAIVASDYQGLGTRGTHPYLATRPAAFSNLDVIRAVQGAEFPLSKRVVLLGQSQGAAAAFATAGHGQTYAPEVDIRGVVATGIPFFTPKALMAVRAARPNDVVDPQLGYNFLALTLVQLIDADFDMDDYLSPRAQPIAREVATICNRDMRKKITQAGLTYDTSFDRSPNAGLLKAYKVMQYPRLKLDVPVFIGSGAKDRDTPLRMQAVLVKRACQAGSKVQAQVYADEDHLSTLNRSLEHSTAFVAAAHAGNPLNGNCF
jgi:pimeloyl-ACP methyl ester carboxylesterase